MTEGPTTRSTRTLPTLERARMAAERHGVLLAYLIPTALSLIAVQTWFEAGTAIATGDLSPPVSPEADYVSHWNHGTSGEGGPTFDVVGLPYAAWLDAWGWFGVGEDVAQRIWVSALFAGSTAAIVFLAFGFALSPLAAGAAGLFGSFNAYRLIVGPDTIPMAALLTAALLGGLVVRAALRPERRPSVVWFAVASLPLGYVMSNPPHVVIVVLWVAACLAVALAVRPGSSAPVFRYLARATPLALLLNLWWIVPALLTISTPIFDERFTAASVDDWTWTHERATLTNALTLNTHWAWSYPEYYPYADGLRDSPFDLFVLALPVLAVAGIVLGWSGHRRLVVGLALTAFAAIWLATGLNGPAPEINRWFYDNVPGYWLFREPSKLLLLVALPLAILGGYGLSRLLARNSSTRQRVLGVGLAAAALLYVHPLFTGDAVPDERPLLPPAHVTVPAAWENASATLNSEPGAGKVLVLPRSDYYQLPTTWGYYGTSFAQSMIGRPVIEVEPGGYFELPRVVDTLVESIETDLLNGRPSGVAHRLGALGVRYVLLRRDIDPDFPNRTIARPNALGRSLARAPGLKRVRSFGLLELYRVGAAKDPGQDVFAATPILYAGTEDAVGPAITTVQRRPGFVSDREDQRSITEAGVRPTRVIRIEHEVARRVTVRQQSRTLRVRLADPFRLTAGGRRLAGASESIRMPAARGPVVITAGDAVMPVRRVPRKWASLGLVGLGAGESVSVWARASSRPVDPAGHGPVRDCSPLENRGPGAEGLGAAIVKRGGRRTLRLGARAHTACVGFNLVSGRTGSALYSVRFRYRQVRGRAPNACLWQHGLGRCASTPALLPGRNWKTFTVAVRPNSRTTGLTLYLYAEGPGEAPGTAVEYQRIRLERYGRAGNVQAGSRVQVFPMSPKTRVLAFSRPPLAPQLDLEQVGPVGDCQRLDERTAEQLGLDARLVRESGSRSLRLTAREHSACVQFAISAIEQGARAYRVRFEYRSVSGRVPRICLWQQGPNRCASLPQLRGSRTWRVVDETVALDADAQALHLFLYADGGGDRLTVADYRNVHVGPIGSVALVGIPRERPLPQIVARREAPWKYHVQVQNARGPFLLATGEAFASGWNASVEDHDDSALRHVEVNGYANGWLVPFKGTYELTLEYGPERYARAARLLSLIGLIGLLGFVALRRLRTFDVRWHTR